MRLLVAALIGPLASGPALAGAGDSVPGARLFRAGAACRSLGRGEHRFGPSLAGVLGRRAGTAAGFRRYSSALRGSNVLWNEVTLDAWIADPRALVPGSRTGFPGLHDARPRADLAAYLAWAQDQSATTARAGAEGDVLAEDRQAAAIVRLPDARPRPPTSRDIAALPGSARPVPAGEDEPEGGRDR